MSMRRRVVISSTLGNALEWFDFTIFGLMALVISKLFFPSENASTALLKTFATFGVAFVARPLGGLLFGLYADRFGRKKALVFMIALMAVGTGMIGVLPTYAQVGLLAPMLILVARLIQGISAGGEFGSASAMLIEFAPPGQRGLYGSSQSVSQTLAFILGGLCGYALNQNLTPQQLESWGWRIPFLLGILIGPVGYFVRHQVDESPIFQRHLQQGNRPEQAPLQTLMRRHRRALLTTFCLTAAATAVTYVTAIYLPAFAAQQLGLPLAQAQLGLIGASCISLVLAPVSGALSDRWGRRTVILPTLLAFSLLFYLAMHRLVAQPDLHHLWTVQAVGALLGFLVGPMPALMTEIFPVQVRSTGASLMYNLAVMLFGGLAPALNTALVKSSGDPLVPAYYVAFASLVGVVGLLALPGASADDEKTFE